MANPAAVSPRFCKSSGPMCADSGLLEPDCPATGHAHSGPGPGRKRVRFPGAGGRRRCTRDCQPGFRRAFRQLSIWKQWDDPDILMKQAVVTVAANPPGIAPLAVVQAAPSSATCRWLRN